MRNRQNSLVVRNSSNFNYTFMESLLDKKNRVKPDWNNPDYAVRRECQSCFKWFDTTNRWAKRCPKCKKKNAPYKKKIINHNVDPF